MEIVIEHAALSIKEKEKKKHKKTTHNKPKDYESIGTECCEELNAELNTGKKSPMLLSPVLNRKAERREAVSEKNCTERTLVRESVKKLIQDENVEKYGLC